MYIERVADIKRKLELRSQFLFGPRLAGKTSYIENELKDRVALRWDLLDTRLRRRVAADPGLLYEQVKGLENSEGIVVVDEIQKVPELLDEVHRLIEETEFRFLLTGSSARKLVRSGVDLLGGRAGRCHMFPFVSPEVVSLDFSLEHVFRSGLLPMAYLSNDPDQVLEDFISTYLYDEIQSEGAVRNLPAFSRFLEVVATSNGNIMNFTNVANDVGLSKTSIREWYRVLTDTLLGFELPPFKGTKKRKAIETAKYYLFDIGVLRALLGWQVPAETQTEYGMFFETFMINEIKAYLSYSGKERVAPLSYWRSASGFEVDVLIGKECAVELKTTRNPLPKDFKGLRAFEEEGICRKHILVCADERKRLVGDSLIVYPWRDFLKDMWDGRLV